MNTEVLRLYFTAQQPQTKALLLPYLKESIVCINKTFPPNLKVVQTCIGQLVMFWPFSHLREAYKQTVQSLGPEECLHLY